MPLREVNMTINAERKLLQLARAGYPLLPWSDETSEDYGLFCESPQPTQDEIEVIVASIADGSDRVPMTRNAERKLAALASAGYPLLPWSDEASEDYGLFAESPQPTDDQIQTILARVSNRELLV
jgi:hypothetical protein